jgi:dihydrofolate synthase/folylpolyglutamate synthase
VAALTNVGLDHMDRLGPTIGAIAREKVAIVKRGDVAVTGADGEALAIMRRRCRRLGVPLRVREPAPILGWTRDVLRVDLPALGAVDVGLRGRHQAANVAVADGLLDALEAAGIATVAPEARREGYARARWPGRLELVETGGREVVLDGAHNAAGAAALVAALEDLRPVLAEPEAPLTLVWASMADKDVAAVVSALAGSPVLERATIVCTAVDLPRAMPPAVLAAAFEAGMGSRGRVTITAAPDVDAALDRVFAGGRGGHGVGPVVIAGSLYLVGAARARLVDDPDLRDP